MKRPPEAAAAGPAVDPLPAVAAVPLSSCPGSNAGDDGSTAPLAAAAPPSSKNGKKKAGGGGDDEGKLGSGIRRLRESEKILRESNAKLQVSGGLIASFVQICWLVGIDWLGEAAHPPARPLSLLSWDGVQCVRSSCVVCQHHEDPPQIFFCKNRGHVGG